MRVHERAVYRKPFAAGEFHFDQGCRRWPAAHYVQYETPVTPRLLCDECELRSRAYKADEASAFFLEAGTRIEFAPGQPVFTERERETRLFGGRAPIYFLLAGQVDLFVGAQKIDSIAPGEIFGEIELIAGAPRCATAVAASTVEAVVVQPQAFQRALKQRPEFALTLLGLLVARVKRAADTTRHQETYRDECVATGGNFLGRKLLRELQERYGEGARVSLPANATIVREGTVGAVVYVVLEGRVDILVGDKLVETIGPGGIFGELAVYSSSLRSATAIAQSDCVLLGLSERDFLDLLYSRPAFVTSLMRALAERLRLMTASRGPQSG